MNKYKKNKTKRKRKSDTNHKSNTKRKSDTKRKSNTKRKSKTNHKSYKSKTFRGGTINPFSDIGNIFYTVGSSIGSVINTLSVPPAGFESNSTNIPFQKITSSIPNSIKDISTKT